MKLSEIVSGEVEAGIHDWIIQTVLDTIETTKPRNEMLAECDELAVGLEPQETSAAWENACNLSYPMIQEAGLTIQAQVLKAIQQDPLIMVQAANPADNDEATLREDYFSYIASQIDVRGALIDLSFYAQRYPFAVASYSWETRMKYTIKDNIQQKEVSYEGVDLRVPHPKNFYIYPANSASIKDATGCGERLYMTREQLVRGIQDYDFDEDAVDKVLKMARVNPYNDDYTREILSGVPDEAKYYEVYVWYTTIPFLEDIMDYADFEKIPQVDIQCYLIPDLDIMLTSDISQYKDRRPYTAFYMFAHPNDFYATSLTHLLSPLQEEANVNFRHYVDCVNFQINPALKIKEAFLKKYQNIRMYPGAVIPFQVDPNEITPMASPQISNQPLEILQIVDQKAQSMYSAGGYGQMPAKVRKNAEVEQVQASRASKFDLMLYNFLRSFEDLVAGIMDMYELFGRGQEFTTQTGEKQPAELSDGKFVSIQAATSKFASPQARMEMAEAKQQAVTNYWMMIGKLPIPQAQQALWRTTRDILIDMGVHRPQQYLGEMPQPPPPAPPQQIQPMQMAMAQGAMNGNQAQGSPGRQQPMAPQPQANNSNGNQ